MRVNRLPLFLFSPNAKPFMSTIQAPPAQDYLEIPGYAEELLREERIRASAWLEVCALTGEIAGIPVRPLTPRLLILLEEVHSGFVVPFDFDSPAELAIEAARFVWVVSTAYEFPRGPLHRLILSWRRRRFIARIYKARGVIEGIKTYLDEAFYDAPAGPADAAKAKRMACVAWPTAIIDLLYSAGYTFTRNEMLDTPFKILWQQYKLALHRLNPDMPLANPSDAYAVRYIEQLNALMRDMINRDSSTNS
jgi:hypothetical protein